MSKKLKVTEQRFNAIKRQLKVKANTKESVAERHGLKVSTIKFISGCKDYATYRGRSTGKKVETIPAVDKGAEDHNIAVVVRTKKQSPTYINGVKPHTTRRNVEAKHAQELLETRTDAATWKRYAKRLEAELEEYRSEDIRQTVATARKSRTVWALLRRGK